MMAASPNTCCFDTESHPTLLSTKHSLFKAFCEIVRELLDDVYIINHHMYSAESPQ